MQLWCRRCRTSFEAPPASGLVPCPSCGATEVSGRSPLAATTERASVRPSTSTIVAAPELPPATSGSANGWAAAPAGPSSPQYPAPNPPAATYPAPTPSAEPSGQYAYPAVPYGQAPAHAPTGQHGLAGPMAQHPYPAYAPPPYPMAYGQGYPYTPPPAQVVVIQNHIQPYAVAAPAVYLRKKDAGVATLLSFVLPGAGQLYNGQVGKGVAFMFLSLFVNVPLLFVGIGFFTWFATWVWSMVDAHRTAEGINRGEIVV